MSFQVDSSQLGQFTRRRFSNNWAWRRGQLSR